MVISPIIALILHVFLFWRLLVLYCIITKSNIFLIFDFYFVGALQKRRAATAMNERYVRMYILPLSCNLVSDLNFGSLDLPLDY